MEVSYILVVVLITGVLMLLKTHQILCLKLWHFIPFNLSHPCGCLGVSNGGMGWWWPFAALGALNVAVYAWNLEGGHHYLHISTIAWPQVKSREGTQLHPSTENYIKIYWAWPHPPEQDPVSSSVSLSHHKASISLLSFSIRGQTVWKPQLQKPNQSSHMDHSLV